MIAASLARYFHERIIDVRIALLWVLLAVAASLDNLSRPLLLPWVAATCALFLVAFRLWDDVADVSHDRQSFPDRYLCRSKNVALFRTTHWFMVVATGGCIFLLTDLSRVVGYVVLVFALWVTYQTTTDQPRLRPVRLGVVLAKYPTLILLLAQSLNHPLPWAAAIVLYVMLVADEARSVGAGILAPSAVVVAAMISSSWVFSVWK